MIRNCRRMSIFPFQIDSAQCLCLQYNCYSPIPIQISASQATMKIKYILCTSRGMFESLKYAHGVNDIRLMISISSISTLSLSKIQFQNRVIFLNKKLFIQFVKTCQFNTILFVDSKNI